MDANVRQVTYHNTELLPDIRQCMNLGCPIVLFTPESSIYACCPKCGGATEWKAESIQYILRKV